MEPGASSDKAVRNFLFSGFSDCQGLGVQRSVVKEELDLPPGLQDGQKIKIKGLGHASDIFAGIPGDLLLTVKVKPH